jgi:hypothetical protein
MADVDIEGKKKAVAQIVEGRVVNDEKRVPICIKGSVLGFPATLEATNFGWPLGCMYYIETKVILDPNKPPQTHPLSLTITPRHGKGILAFIFRLLLLESHGMQLSDKRIQSNFVVTYADRDIAERFLKYPGVFDNLLKLEKYCQFGEMQIKGDAGIYFSQSNSFKDLDLDVCRETFRALSELGQVLFEAF